ncbi:uncharacterized protein LOC132742032 [Ruditapes philippinarum]|uniref:uncharacterized protein LOC132742032 n=1 Tax=Ruditapes philippinarum TaxID=129788 RepID=UPI00295A8F52|nr:uncharacterized protein LOC132742032 [Ruditapes philippinarum]
MEEHCDTMIHMIMDSVYQIRLQLDDIYIQSRQSARPATCQTEIEPWYTWPNLMFYFEDLDLDCEFGYLQFFQVTTNSTRVKGLEANICGDAKPKGIFVLDKERYLQVRYVAKRNQYIEGAFSIIITSYTEEPCPDHSFKCDNSRCIDREIRCDGYDSCGDGSGCRFDLSSAAIAAIIICSLVGLFVLISTAICVVCCVKKSRKSQERAQNQAQPGLVYTVTADGNGTLSPPSYTSGQNGQRRLNDSSSTNSAAHRSTSPPSAQPPTNFTAGQSPAYPPNFTMPSYQEDIFQIPPPYEEMQTCVQDRIESTERVRENTDNDVLENINPTDISVNEVTDRTKVEETKENTNNSAATAEVNYHDSASVETDQNEDTTYEIISDPADVLETNDNKSDCKNIGKNFTDNTSEESEKEVANSYTNVLYSGENDNFVNREQSLENGTTSGVVVDKKFSA